MDRPSQEELDGCLRAFLAEDVGSGDVTTERTVPAGLLARARIVAKSECVVSGLPVARRVFELLDGAIAWRPGVEAGTRVSPGTELSWLSGNARAILTGERVALNLVQRMCGIATETRRFVDAVEGTGCRILDTRKTAPGLRAFDREAVRDGGGTNHRFGLSDMVLIKDNHRLAAGGVARAVAAARTARTGVRDVPVEAEIESEQDLRDAIGAGARRLLFDNQAPATVARWVRLARALATDCWIEASGGVNLANVRDYARAGVDAVSVGSLTHSVRAADISLELDLLDSETSR